MSRKDWSNDTDMQKPKYWEKNPSQHHFAHCKSHMGCPVVLVGKFKGKQPFGRSRYSREYKSKMDINKMGWKGADWLYLSEDRDKWQAAIKTIMNFQVA
jgi:hypothetical protein